MLERLLSHLELKVIRLVVFRSVQSSSLASTTTACESALLALALPGFTTLPKPWKVQVIQGYEEFRERKATISLCVSGMSVHDLVMKHAVLISVFEFRRVRGFEILGPV